MAACQWVQFITQGIERLSDFYEGHGNRSEVKLVLFFKRMGSLVLLFCGNALSIKTMQSKIKKPDFSYIDHFSSCWFKIIQFLKQCKVVTGKKLLLNLFGDIFILFHFVHYSFALRKVADQSEHSTSRKLLIDW